MYHSFSHLLDQLEQEIDQRLVNYLSESDKPSGDSLTTLLMTLRDLTTGSPQMYSIEAMLKHHENKRHEKLLWLMSAKVATGYQLEEADATPRMTAQWSRTVMSRVGDDLFLLDPYIKRQKNQKQRVCRLSLQRVVFHSLHQVTEPLSCHPRRRPPPLNDTQWQSYQT